MALHDTSQSHVVKQLVTSCDGQAGARNNLQATAARKEVEATYGPDVLQLKPLKWHRSVYVNNHKYHGPTVHAHLSNCLLPQHLCPSDFRRLCMPTDMSSVKHSAEFTQGQATTGWNFSTCTDSVFQLASNNIPATTPGLREYKLQEYCTPIDSVAAITDKHRVAKQLSALQLQRWTEAFGKEGAAAMQQISQLQPKKSKTTFLATKSDISAVASLEDVLPNVDSQLSTLLSCPWLPGVISSRSGMLPLGATRHKPSSPMVVDLYSLAAAVDSSAAVADSSVAVMDTSPAVVDALAAADAGAPLAAAAAAAAYPAVEGPCMQPITPVGIFSASDSSADAAAETPLYSA